MSRRRVQLTAVVAVMGLLGVAAAAVAGGGGNRNVREHLTGYAETPLALSTSGFGDFKAKVRDDRIEYKLTFGQLEGDVTQAHIHFGSESQSGGISAFLCNQTNPAAPAGTPACATAPDLRSGTVEGTIEPSDVVGPAGQGIDPGQYGELLRAIRAGATYANVHSSKYPGGEVRAQLEGHHH